MEAVIFQYNGKCHSYIQSKAQCSNPIADELVEYVALMLNESSFRKRDKKIVEKVPKIPLGINRQIEIF